MHVEEKVLCFVKTSNMDFFYLNKEFNSFEEVLIAKSGYEKANNAVLSKTDCHKLKGDGDLVKNMIYQRLSLSCKAGKERKSKSKGIRQVSTIKKNCPMKVKHLNRLHHSNMNLHERIFSVCPQINFSFQNNKLKVTSIHEQHENHQMNPQTFRHFTPKTFACHQRKRQSVNRWLRQMLTKRK